MGLQSDMGLGGQSPPPPYIMGSCSDFPLKRFQEKNLRKGWGLCQAISPPGPHPGAALAQRLQCAFSAGKRA